MNENLSGLYKPLFVCLADQHGLCVMASLHTSKNNTQVQVTRYDKPVALFKFMAPCANGIKLVVMIG